jgi:hypothetical protein
VLMCHSRSDYIRWLSISFDIKHYVLHVSGATHARLPVHWVHSAELFNSAGAMGSLSESLIFPRVLNVSKRSQCCLQVMIKRPTHCLQKDLKVQKVAGRDHAEKMIISTRNV